MNNVRVLTGSSGIKDGYEEMMILDKLDVVFLSENYADVIGDFFDTVVYPSLKRKAVREVVPYSSKNKDYQKKMSQENYPIGLLKDYKASESDLLIGEAKACVISFNSASPFALIIEDSELISLLKTLFLAVWTRSDK